MAAEFISLLECLKDQVDNKLENHYDIESNISIDGEKITIRFYDRVISFAIMNIINRRDIEDCNYLNVVGFYVDRMLRDIENARREKLGLY